MTEMVTMTRLGDKIQVKAWGGYDGFIRREFDTVEDALVYVEYLWTV